jgi:hypothetical protein
MVKSSSNTPRRQVEGRGTVLPILNLIPRRVWVVNATPWLLYPQEKEPIPILKEAGWASGLVWTNLTPHSLTGFEPSDLHPVASHSTDYIILAPWFATSTCVPKHGSTQRVTEFVTPFDVGSCWSTQQVTRDFQPFLCCLLPKNWRIMTYN